MKLKTICSQIYQIRIYAVIDLSGGNRFENIRIKAQKNSGHYCNMLFIDDRFLR